MIAPQNGTSWRDALNYFHSGEHLEGVLNISPGWFQKCHDVSGLMSRLYSLMLILNQGRSQQYPQPSANIRLSAVSDWLDAISESNGVLSAILSVIHPKLYDAGLETIKRLQNTPEIAQDALSRWASVFSGVALISNRTTPSHRDGSSRVNWYDILVTLGRYRNCHLELPGLGVSLEYGPGTVVGLSGQVIEHGVPNYEGDRVSYAYFMRDNVHEWANIPCKDWMDTSCYE